MLENFDLSMINWSRGQFALTAIYHWLFVPLTLGLSFILAIMETIYVRTGNEEWKKITKFWMTLFGVNFAIGIATGIILEFQFGTNWSNYSWFVGDIFGAPLAIEGLMAFFLESTFVAVMFFGWNKIGKKAHLTATWLTAIGTNLSALWILVANAWMQYPAGMHFNPDTARNEMINFWDVFLSPVAINKFLHTVMSGYVTGGLFVIGISAWFLLMRRNHELAKKSIIVASIFAFIANLYLGHTGDGSAKQVADKQPMKLAAIEGLHQGKTNAGLIILGLHNPGKKVNDGKEPFLFKIEVPKLLSIMSFHNANAYVPGIEDLVNGNPAQNIMPVKEKMERGKTAISTLREYNEAKKAKDTLKTKALAMKFDNSTPEGKNFTENYFRYFGYGYLNNPESIVPNVPLTFYSFHIMVALALWFGLLILLVFHYIYRKKLEKQRWLLWLCVITIPLAWVASECGWIVAEMGRQPWVIQDYLPTIAAVSQLDVATVKITFFLFVIIFTALLIADITIIRRKVILKNENF